MKTITISITVPDDVELAVQTSPPTNLHHSSTYEGQEPPHDLPASQGGTWPAGACPKHGPDKWDVSKFGGHYCKAHDDSQERGYCTIKSGILFNGKRVPQ